MAENRKFDKDRLRTFIRNVRQEILNLQAGESKFRTSAVHFPVSVSGNKVPVLQRLDALEEFPSQKSLDLFLMLASQDLSARAGAAFETWSTGIFPVDAERNAKALVKPFELQIKDGFYDLFRAAQIPLNPKQVDLIMTHSGKLAKTFQGEIHKTVKEQLEVLVAKLKTEEASKEKPVKKQVKKQVEKPVVVKTGSNSASGYNGDTS